MSEYPELFTVSEDGKSIRCRVCNLTSHNPQDVLHQYCGRCDLFLGDIWPPSRQWVLDNWQAKKSHITRIKKG